MKRIALALGLAAITTACNPPKKQTPNVNSSNSQPAVGDVGEVGVIVPVGDPAEPPVVVPVTPMNIAAPLIATWTKCETSPDFKFEDYKGIMETITVKDEKSLEVRAEFFKDAECKTKFAQADADAALKEIPTNAHPLEVQYFKEYWKALLEGMSVPSTYSATALNAQGIGEFDVQTKDAAAEFLSYKIDGNKLYFTEACFSEELIEEEYWEAEEYPSEPGDSVKLTAGLKPKVKVIKPHMMLPAMMSVKPRQVGSKPISRTPTLALSSPTQPSPQGAPIPIDDEGPYVPGGTYQYPKGCGEKASNRSTDFSAVLPYLKK